MDYNFLGKSGVKVSNICLGTMTFGGKDTGSFTDWPTSVEEQGAHQLMDRFAKLGGNFIDTANIYGYGQSEQIVGSWLKKHERNEFVVATKVRFSMNFLKQNEVGLSRRHIIKSCEQSLERLQTPYIDLYQSHAWDSAAPIDETLRTFDDLIRCGKIRYMGVSNVTGWQMQKIVDRIESMGLNSCVSLQQQYNLLTRYSEKEEFMVCRNEGVGVLPWGPLKGGLLTGKFQRDALPSATGSRIGFIANDSSKALVTLPEWDKVKSDDSYWQLIDVLKAIAKKHGKTIPQVCIRWLIQKDVVASVIIGATSIKQLEDNCGASSGWKLTDDDMTQLDKASTRESHYPYDMINLFDRCNSFNRT